MAIVTTADANLNQFITRIVQEKHAVEQKTSLPSIACFFKEAIEELNSIEETLNNHLDDAEDVIALTSTIAEKINHFSETIQTICGGKRLVVRHKLKKLTSHKLTFFEKTRRKLERLHKKYSKTRRFSVSEIIAGLDVLIKEMNAIKTILRSIVLRSHTSDEELSHVLVTIVHITDHLDYLLNDPCDPVPYRL